VELNRLKLIITGNRKRIDFSVLLFEVDVVAVSRPHPTSITDRHYPTGQRYSTICLRAFNQYSSESPGTKSNSRIPTPNLDGLAAAGMTFTDEHSPSNRSDKERDDDEM
jgi:hypothetical protein